MKLTEDFWAGPQGQEEDIEDEEEFTEDVSDAERHGTVAFNTLLDEELMMEEFDKASSDDLLLASSMSYDRQVCLANFYGLSVWPLLFEATMPRRYARSDVRDSDTTSVDIQTHYLALKLRVSMSVSLIRRVTPRGRGSGVFREHRFPRRIAPNRRSRV